MQLTEVKYDKLVPTLERMFELIKQSTEKIVINTEKDTYKTTRIEILVGNEKFVFTNNQTYSSGISIITSEPQPKYYIDCSIGQMKLATRVFSTLAERQAFIDATPEAMRAMLVLREENV